MFGALLDALSMPGDYTRGLLAGRPGDRVHPRDLLAGYGMADPQDDSWLALARDMGVGALTDPLTYAGGLVGRGLIGRRAAAAASPEAALLDTGANARMVPMGSGEVFPSAWGESGYDRALRAAATPPEGALPGMSQAALEADAGQQAAREAQAAWLAQPGPGPLPVGGSHGLTGQAPPRVPYGDPAKATPLMRQEMEQELAGLYGMYGDLVEDLKAGRVSPGVDHLFERTGLGAEIARGEEQLMRDFPDFERAFTPREGELARDLEQHGATLRTLLSARGLSPSVREAAVDVYGHNNLAHQAAGIDNAMGRLYGVLPRRDYSVPTLFDQTDRLVQGTLQPERVSPLLKELEAAGYPIDPGNLARQYTHGVEGNLQNDLPQLLVNTGAHGPDNVTRDAAERLLGMLPEDQALPWFRRIGAERQRLQELEAQIAAHPDPHPASVAPDAAHFRRQEAGRQMLDEVLRQILTSTGLH